MKTLEDEQYIVIKAYKLTVFEIWRDFNVIPTLESTDSMITIACLCDPYVIESTNSTIPTDM